MRRFVRVIAFIGTLIVGAAALSLVVSQTPWFKDWLRGYIVRQANGFLEGRLSIGRLGGNLFFGVELEDVAVALDGEPVVAVKDIGLDYSILDFASRGIVLDDIRLNQPVVRLVREQDGWNLGRLVKERAREAEREGPGLPIAIGEIGISDGTITIDGPLGGDAVDVPRRFEGLNASVGFQYEPVRYTVDIGHLSFSATQPELVLEDLSGRVAVAGDSVHVEDLAIRTRESALSLDAAVRGYQDTPIIQATASSDKIALDELARILPALRGYTLQPAFEIKARGTLDALEIDLDARSSAGSVDAQVVAGLQPGVRSVRGRIDLRSLDLAPLLRNAAQRSDITGVADVDLRISDRGAGGALDALAGRWAVRAPQVAVMGYRARDVDARGRFENGVIRLDAARASAYGGRATARGTIAPGPPFALDLKGDASSVDLRNLPREWGMPGAPGDLNVSYHVRGPVTPSGRRDLMADVAFRPSTLAGAAIGGGSTARVRLGPPGRIAYAANLRVRELDLQRLATAFGIDALADERYRTGLNGRVEAEGSGTSLDALTLSARGTLEDSAVFGGRLPALDFEAAIADREAEVRAKGAFAGIDPAVAAGQGEDSRLAGRVSGTLDVELAIRGLGEPMTPGSLDASGRVELVESRLAGLPIDRAFVQGRYADRAGTLESLQVTTPDLKLEASGPVNLRQDGGASNVEFRADVGRLETFAALADAPLSGSAQVEGRVGGNGSELTVDGKLQASNVKYAEHSVLSANTAYGVRLPDLSVRDAVVTVDGSASLLVIGGRELTDVDLEATWAHPSVSFKTTVTAEQRSVTAAGDVVLHPDHQEVHLADFAVRTEGLAWQAAAGTEAAIRYGGGRVEVDNLHLVSGDQQISAAGSFGGEQGGELHVSAQNVDLAAVDRLALGEQRLGGRLTANATVTGTTEAPEVDATFSIRNGSFREYEYQALDGTAAYTADGVQLDARLTQNPAAWITAKGFVPTALFKAGAAGTAAASDRELDLTVTSSELDLAVIQGFVPQLSKVSGRLQAEVRATGAADDPHFDGYVEIRNGAFTVADLTAGGYTGLDTRITLAPDRVVINRLRILDEHENWLEIDGQIAVHERQVGQVQVAVKASDFEVIDNELADVKIDSDLRLTGQLQQPRVDGTVGVRTGTIHLDRILTDLVTDAYALQPTELETAPQAAAVTPADGATARAEAGQPVRPDQAPEPEADAEPSGTMFERLVLDVALTVPNNLVIRGANLNPGGAAPIALGDVNVTVGGDIRARKARGERDVSLVGTITTVRGTYDFQGRRFEIDRDGRIQFTGGSEIDPRLDITARRVISGVEALVHVRGTARAPELTLSSRPPLDEADILSLIVFNQPVNALGEGQQITLAERAGALATGFVASSLAQSIGGALELDIFEIQTTAESGGGGTLTVGEQVGERLFIRFRQGFGAQAISEFILEYQLADFLRLQTSLAEGGNANRRTLMRRVEQGGIDLIFFFTY